MGKGRQIKRNRVFNTYVSVELSKRAGPFSPINFRAWALNIEPEF